MIQGKLNIRSKSTSYCWMIGYRRGWRISIPTWKLLPSFAIPYTAPLATIYTRPTFSDPTAGRCRAHRQFKKSEYLLNFFNLTNLAFFKIIRRSRLSSPERINQLNISPVAGHLSRRKSSICINSRQVAQLYGYKHEEWAPIPNAQLHSGQEQLWLLIGPLVPLFPTQTVFGHWWQWDQRFV